MSAAYVLLAVPVWSHGWWTTDRTIGVVGGIATLLALGIAFWQLVRTRRAAEAARQASLATRRVLRTSDLRRAFEVSLEIGRRVNSEGDPGRARAPFRFHLNDWLTAAHRIRGLIDAQRTASSPTWDTLLQAMESARGEVLVAREAADTAAAWSEYRVGVLRRALITYGDAVEAAIVAGDDRLVDDNAG